MSTDNPQSQTSTVTPGDVTPSTVENGQRPQTTESRPEVELTDQTNLLPLRKIIPIFLGLAVCILVSTLDSTIVATALPTITSTFNAGSVISWVPSSYLLTSTAFQPLYGRLSDIFGRKAGMVFAMSIYMIGNLAAGFSKTIVQLIVFRGIAGAGGGGILSMGQIVMSDVVSLRDRGKYQGIIGGIVAVGYAIGPLIGGAVAQKVSWKWAFWITLPVSLVATVIVIFILPLKRVEGNIRRKLLIIDYFGAFLTLVGCALVVLPLIWGGVTFPWTSAVVLAPLISGIVVVGIFCAWEWKVAKLPIVPMYIFKHTTVTGVYIGTFINGIITYSSLFYLPQFFQVALGYSPIRSGVFLLPLLVTMVCASMCAGQIVSRTGRYRAIIFLGFAVWSLGCGLISLLRPTTPEAVTIVFMLLTGAGSGGTLQTTTVAAQASVSRRDMGIVTAVRNFMRLLGGTLALALGSTILNNYLTQAMRGLALSEGAVKAVVDDPTLLGTRFSAASAQTLEALGISTELAGGPILDGYVRGFRIVFILNASLSAVAFITSVLLIRHKELTRPDEARLREEAKAALQSKKKANSGHAIPLVVEKYGQEEASDIIEMSSRTEEHQDERGSEEEGVEKAEVSKV